MASPVCTVVRIDPVTNQKLILSLVVHSGEREIRSLRCQRNWEGKAEKRAAQDAQRKRSGRAQKPRSSDDNSEKR